MYTYICILCIYTVGTKHSQTPIIITQLHIVSHPKKNRTKKLWNMFRGGYKNF